MNKHIISIELYSGVIYTETSKYYELSLSELEKIFSQRLLDWNYYFSKAKKESFSCSLGAVTPRCILTEDLQFYDDCIRDFYKKQIKNKIKLSQIFKEFKELQSKKEYNNLKFLQ